MSGAASKRNRPGKFRRNALYNTKWLLQSVCKFERSSMDCLAVIRRLRPRKRGDVDERAVLLASRDVLPSSDSESAPAVLFVFQYRAARATIFPRGPGVARQQECRRELDCLPRSSA